MPTVGPLEKGLHIVTVNLLSSPDSRTSFPRSISVKEASWHSAVYIMKDLAQGLIIIARRRKQLEWRKRFL